LIMHPVHCPHLIGSCCITAVIPQFGHDAPAWRFEPHLQAFQPIEPMHALDVHMPAFTTQQYGDAAVAISHPCLGDLADTLSEGRLLGSARTVVICRAACRNGSAGSADRHLERSTHEVDHLASPSRRHSLRRITSCNISLSSVRSATTLRSLPFSSSSCRKLFHLGGHQAAIELLSSDRTSLPRCPSCGTPRQPAFRSQPAGARMQSAVQ